LYMVHRIGSGVSSSVRVSRATLRIDPIVAVDCCSEGFDWCGSSDGGAI
jgi:hypothetical protein